MVPSNKMVNDLVGTSISGASYLISLQLFSRILTFMLNQFVVKLVGSKVYGAAMVDFELLLSTILFLSREGFRCALLRANVDESSKMSSHITLRQSNLAYLPIPIGLLISSILVLYHLMGNKLQSEVPCYYASAALYVAAAMVELLSEPLYILNLSQLNYPLRFKIEASAVFLKCVCTFIISFGLFHFIGEASSEYAILSFGVSQLVYSFVLLAGYTKHFSSRSGLSLFPSKVSGASSWEEHFDMPLLRLSLTLSVQSFVKHLLTEGDKLLLAFLNSTGVEKGSYSVAAHYGSLVARILFQPIEESGRGLFSKLLSGYDGKLSDSKEELTAASTASDFLTTIIKFHILLGFVFIFMVPHYTSTLFDLLLGPAWSKTNAPLILSVYCFYVPIMGINGITEAFVQAVAQPEELQALSYALSLFTAIFLAVGFCLVKILPSVAYAVILANCLNFSLRIFWSLRYIIRYFHSATSKTGLHKPLFELPSALPSRRILASFIVASVICGYSEFVFGFETFVGKAKHVVIGGLCFLAVCAFIVLEERRFIRDLRILLHRPPKHTKEE